MHIKIGTRDSKLALIQTEIACKQLSVAHPNIKLDFEIIKIKTLGDQIQNKSLAEIGGKNLFIKELEIALLNKQIDFAVHSYKDMTGKADNRLIVASCLEREDPRDAFVSGKFKDINSLPENALVGTSSIRRKSLALQLRPDLMLVSLRGNVLTRIEKLLKNDVDATFLAMAGLKRLNVSSNIYMPLSVDHFIPAVCQGIICLECHKDNQDIYQLLRKTNHELTEICATAERSFLEFLEADCSMPIAAYAKLEGDKIELRAMVIDKKGKSYFANASAYFNLNAAAELGIKLGHKLRDYLYL